MRRFLIYVTFLIVFFLPLSYSFADEQNVLPVKVYSGEKNGFGLKNDNAIITEPSFNKLVRLSDTSWIAQKGRKYGIINSNGEYLVKPKYRHAERLFGKYVKLGNDNDYGVYDAQGNIIVKPMYSKIDPLYGKMFLTYRNFKYGVVDMQGKELLPNKFDDIYMPTFKTMRLKYKGVWFEIAKVDKEVSMPENMEKIVINDTEYAITNVLVNTGLWSGYSALTATDYIVKLFSSISPAYEDTIDDLMLMHGTDSISIFMKFSWLPKFPITYARKYYANFIAPNNGPLVDVRDALRNQIK